MISSMRRFVALLWYEGGSITVLVDIVWWVCRCEGGEGEAGKGEDESFLFAGPEERGREGVRREGQQ